VDTDTGMLIATIGAGGISVIALIVSIWAGVSSRRNAVAAEDSAVSARESADASRDSARSAAAVAQAEVSRDHRAHMPPRTGRFVGRDGELYYEFTLDQPYEIRARATGHAGAVVNDLTPARRTADGVWFFNVGHLDQDRLVEPFDTLTVRFWPPERRTGEPEPWTCPCGLPQQVGDGSAAHWQWSDIGIPRDRGPVHTETP
jgi:hypothetical protein